jgi:hypothetical protein
MIRKVLASTGAVIALSLVALGCENKADRDQARAEQAQREANEKAASAQREANEKIDQAQREANDQMQKAQTKAAEDKNAAIASFNKDRGDYREKVQKNIDDVDKTLSDVRTKEAGKSARDKADLEASAKLCQTRRDALTNDMRQIDSVTQENWTALRTSVDRDLDSTSGGAPKCALNEVSTRTIEGKRVIETRHGDDGKPAPQPAPVPYTAPGTTQHQDGTRHPEDTNHNSTTPRAPATQP